MSKLYGASFTADLEFEERRMDRLRPQYNLAVQEAEEGAQERREAARHQEPDAGLERYRDKRRIA
jgi:hypothetical protein